MANLSFGDTRYQCVLPWKSIFSMTQHATGMRRLFVEDFPPELLATMKAGDNSEGEKVAEEVESPSELADDCGTPPASETGTPHLRLV